MNKPTRPGDTALVTGLLVLDVVALGWLAYRVGLNGWADSFAHRSPEAPGLARRCMWWSAGAAVVTGGGLLAAGRRRAGLLQLLLLGGAAVVFGVTAEVMK